VVPTDSPYDTGFSVFFSTKYIRSSTLDLVKLPTIRSNTISHEAGYFETSTLSSSLRKQAPYSYT